MAHIVSGPASTRDTTGMALEVGATITAACVSLLVFLIPAAVVVFAITMVADVPPAYQNRAWPLAAAGVSLYLIVFAAGVLLLAFGRSRRHHR